MTTFILSVSILLQILAAGYALSLIRTSGKSVGWGLLAAAMTLMSFRRCITLYNQVTGIRASHLATELVALLISVLVFTGIVLVGSTVRKMRRAEEIDRLNHQLAREKNLLDKLVQNMPDAIYFKDRQCRFVRVNPGACRIFGVESAEDVLGKSDADFFTKKEADEYYADEQRLMQQDKPLIGKEEHELWPDGHMHWVLTTKMPWHDSHGAVIGTFGISRDITELKRAEEALEIANEELLRSNVDLEHFAYVASHDLQEPLRAVTGYCQLLARRARDKLNEKECEFLDGALVGAQRMHSLIDDLLEYSRVNRHGDVIAPTDMNRVLKAALVPLATIIEATAAEFDSESLPTIHVDAGQMERVLQNLIGNALKYRSDEPPRIRVCASEDEAEWSFSVIDNGLGIDAKFHEKVFLLFQRLHSRVEYDGTGLGLAICKRIVERHGGRIWVDSQAGQGATFTFAIPKSCQQKERVSVATATG